jgi:hypothetical protein
MDGSRSRRHRHNAQSAWLAAYRTARWARRFLSRQLPDLNTIRSLAISNLTRGQS